MNEVREEDDAAILIVSTKDDIKISTHGEPRKLQFLKDWVYKWLGGGNQR
jgi:hypothetical protein